MKKTIPLIILVALAIVQLALLDGRIGPARGGGGAIGVGDDLFDIRATGADGTERPLGGGGQVLVLVFDPQCAHTQRVAPQWRSWLRDAKGSARVLALAPGPYSGADAYARANGWAAPVATIAGGAIGGREHALVSRTPWVFALDGAGRVVAEGHGSRLHEVAEALQVGLAESPAVRSNPHGWEDR